MAGRGFLTVGVISVVLFNTLGVDGLFFVVLIACTFCCYACVGFALCCGWFVLLDSVIVGWVGLIVLL